MAHAQDAEPFAIPGIHWAPDLQTGADLARIQHKPMCVYLHTRWSGLCRLLENNALRDTNVQRLLNDYFVPMHLPGDSPDPIWFRGLQYRYDSTAHVHRLAYELMQGQTDFPTIVILNAQGEILTPIIGRVTAARLRKILDYYAEDTYMLISWDEFDAKRQY
ncbi:MAG: thioredoxin family protein [Bacteroidota bacterium]